MSVSQEKILYIVPNTTLPYGYELVNILGFPEGTRSRFRFTEKWVSAEVKYDHSSFEGKEFTIVLRDREEAKFYPIRYAKIDGIKKIADTYYIEYLLGELIPYENDEYGRDNQIAEFNNEFIRYNGLEKVNIKNNDMKPLVFVSEYKPTFETYITRKTDKKEQLLSKFQNIIELVKKIRFYEGVEFIKIIRVTEKNTNIDAKIRDGSYQLKEHTDYVLSIYQILPVETDQDTDPRDIEITSDKKYVNIVSGKKRLVGRYDILNFIFRINENTSGVKTFIDINHKIKFDSEKYIDPSSRIEIDINKNYFKYFWFGFIFIIALALEFLPDLFFRTKDYFKPETVDFILTILYSYLFVEFMFGFKSKFLRK